MAIMQVFQLARRIEINVYYYIIFWFSINRVSTSLVQT